MVVSNFKIRRITVKRITFITLVIVLLLPLLVIGCKTEEPTSPSVPPLNGGQKAVTIEITTDEFMSNKHITKSVDLIAPGSLIVTLGSNKTTGYQWAENAVNSNPAVIEQESHNYVAPTNTAVVGAPGKEVWVFNSLKAGTATLTMSYSRPFDATTKDEWTLTLNVTVK